MFTKMQEKMQELFDNATRGVILQGVPSLDDSGSTCRYRGTKNTKCAIGHVLSDELMAKHPKLEGSAPRTFPIGLIEEIYGESFSSKNDLHYFVHFLTELQNAHDNASKTNFINSFIEEANKVARNFGLNPISK